MSTFLHVFSRRRENCLLDLRSTTVGDKGCVCTPNPGSEPGKTHPRVNKRKITCRNTTAPMRLWFSLLHTHLETGNDLSGVRSSFRVGSLRVRTFVFDHFSCMRTEEAHDSYDILQSAQGILGESQASVRAPALRRHVEA